MSYATIFIPSSGIMAAYTDPNEFAHAFGIYLASWLMVTFFFLFVFNLFLSSFTLLIKPLNRLAVIRRNMSYTLLLSALLLAFICLTAAEFTQNARCSHFFRISPPN